MLGRGHHIAIKEVIHLSTPPDGERIVHTDWAWVWEQGRTEIERERVAWWVEKGKGSQELRE